MKAGKSRETHLASVQQKPHRYLPSTHADPTEIQSLINNYLLVEKTSKVMENLFPLLTVIVAYSTAAQVINYVELLPPPLQIPEFPAKAEELLPHFLFVLIFNYVAARARMLYLEKQIENHLFEPRDESLTSPEENYYLSPLSAREKKKLSSRRSILHDFHTRSARR